MPDEERIELMIRVKEGKISMHDAVERVRDTFLFHFWNTNSRDVVEKHYCATISSVHSKCSLLFILGVYLQCKLFGEQIILLRIFFLSSCQFSSVCTSGSKEIKFTGFI